VESIHHLLVVGVSQNLVELQKAELQTTVAVGRVGDLVVDQVVVVQPQAEA
jgi:hypothetical protein